MEAVFIDISGNTVIYLDILSANEFLMNGLVLAVYCICTGKKYSMKSLLAADLLTTLTTVMTIVLLKEINIEYISGSGLWFLSLTGCLSELYILNQLDKRTEGIRILAEVPFLLISMFTVGGMAGSITRFSADSKKNLLSEAVLFVTAGGSGCFLLGYGILYKWRKKEITDEILCDVRIMWNHRICSVPAMIDTGNNLYTPNDRKPVHIVEESCLLKPGEIEELLLKNPEKIAFVPYSSLGKTNGIIRVIEADKLEIVRGTYTYPIYHQKLGLTAQKLSSSGKWKMLLHREIKEAV